MTDLRLTQPAVLGNILHILLRKGHRVQPLEHLRLEGVTHLLREAWHACLESWEARGLFEFIEERGKFAPSYSEGSYGPARTDPLADSRDIYLFIFYRLRIFDDGGGGGGDNITDALVNATRDSGTSATAAIWVRMEPDWALKLEVLSPVNWIERSTDFQ